MSIQFRSAVREQTSVLVGISGPSSSGKTYSALRLAAGLAGDGEVFGIDTESRRMLHYADTFAFQHGDLTAPFRPNRYLEALQAAKAAGASVIVVDSMSHVHEGPGGILEWHEEEVDRMAGGQQWKRDQVNFAAWIKPKQEHNRLVNEILQLGLHCIFCFRAKPKLKLVKNDRGKTEPVDLGWQPICADRFEYEMTVRLMLPPNSQGRPDLSHDSTKLPDQISGIFRDGQQLTEDHGRKLAEWARGGGEAPETDRSQTGARPEPAKKAGGNGRDAAEGFVSMMADAYGRAQSVDELDAIDGRASKNLQRLKTNHADLYERVEEAYRARWAEVAEPRLGGDADAADADMFETQEE